MSFLGNLLTKKADVRGRISIVNRPTDTHFALFAYFLACEPKAPPPGTGLPEDGAWERWPAGAPVKKDGPLRDIGDEFTASLAPGDYQVLITALPFIIEGKKLTMGEASTRFGFWPVPAALHLEGGKERVLSLRLEFPTGLGKFGESAPGTPLMSRIGAVLAGQFAEAAAFGNAGRNAEALAAYEALLAGAGLKGLTPADGNEFRMVLELGRLKCLLALGRTREAAALRDSLVGGLLPKLRLSEGDPMTAWELFTMLMLVSAWAGPLGMIPEGIPMAFDVLAPFFREGGPRAQSAAQLATGFVRQLAWKLRTQREWQTLLAVLSALDLVAPPAATELVAMTWVYRMEALIAIGQSAEASMLADDVRARGPDVTHAIAQLAAREQLEAARAILLG